MFNQINYRNQAKCDGFGYWNGTVSSDYNEIQNINEDERSIALSE